MEAIRVNRLQLPVLILFCLRCIAAETPSTLRLSHVVFRHGDRSPTTTFPTDKYQEDAWPQGFGQLTQRGMKQEYEMGKMLRRLHAGFLTERYDRHQIYVRSTDMDRTLMSAYTALAGLYPPNGTQVWEESIKWQPIPVHTVDYDTDNLLRAGTPCDRYNPMGKAAFTSEEVKTYQAENKDFLDMVRRESGLPNANLYDIMEKVPNPLFCERAQNWTLPDWVSDEVFDRLQDLKNFQIKLWFYTPEMQRIRAGIFLKELVNHTKSLASGSLDSRKRMFIYSAHDTTLAVQLVALDAWDGLMPPYSSVLMFEQHQRDDGSFFMRMRYKNDTLENPEGEPVTLSMRGCELDCDLDKFYSLVQPMVYEGDWFKDCQMVEPDNSKAPGTSALMIAIFVCVAIIVLLLIPLTIFCYRRGRKGASYHSAQFCYGPS